MKNAPVSRRAIMRFSTAVPKRRSRHSGVHRALSAQAGRAFWLGGRVPCGIPHSNGPCPGFAPGSLATFRAHLGAATTTAWFVLVKFAARIIRLRTRAREPRKRRTGRAPRSSRQATRFTRTRPISKNGRIRSRRRVRGALPSQQHGAAFNMRVHSNSIASR